MRLNGSVNIVHSTEDSSQMHGAVNIGSSVLTEFDVSGESVLLGSIASVIVKIDIMPSDIKTALEQSGVKFT